MGPPTLQNLRNLLILVQNLRKTYFTAICTIVRKNKKNEVSMDSILPLYFFYSSISFIVNSYLLNLGQINCAIIKSFQQPWENIKNFTF